MGLASRVQFWVPIHNQLSYNGNYTPLVRVRFQFNSGLLIGLMVEWNTRYLEEVVSERMSGFESQLDHKNAGVSRCGNGVRLISGLVYPFAGSSPATGTYAPMT